MRIVLDLQACQTSGSRNRGIGRYSMSLALAMARQAGEHEIIIVLNNRFPETIAPIRKAFNGLVRPENILAFDVPGPLLEYDPASAWRCQAAERVREIFLAELSPDIVHISSLFEGWGDDAVTPIGHFNNRFETAVTLYDLIPLLYEETYLTEPVSRALYYRKLQALKNAELLLAISDHSRREAITTLQLAEHQVVNISSAADDMFRPRSLSIEESNSIKNRLGLSKPFLMYTGGIDWRKNIEGLIEAFSLLPEATRAQYQLAVVCKMHETDLQRLRALAVRFGLMHNEVVFTGFVSDDDLVALYNLAKLFVFPSLHEGFGLPVLEAMSCGTPVVGSQTSSIPEVIGRGDILFDPNDARAIAEKIQSVLTDADLYRTLREHGFKQAKKFSWDKSAKRTLDAFETLHQFKQERRRVAIPVKQPRPRLAYLSPLPPEQSGIADYSAELLPELARHYHIEVIIAQATVEETWINANFQVRSVEWFEDHADRYDRIIYHFGNSMLHEHMFGLLARHPGVVVLHDFFLSGVPDNLDHSGRDPGAFSRALYESHGYSALLDTARIGRLEAILKYPCNKHVLDQAIGVIAHSRFSMQLAEAWYGKGSAKDWRYAPLLKALPPVVDRQAARKRLGLKDGDFLVCSFGMLAPTKLNNRLLKAWQDSSLATDARCHLVFVGQNDNNEYGQSLVDAIASSGCHDRIRITGFVSQEIYRTYLASADMAVQLRSHSRGETSASILDCLIYGIPTIINANGAAAELSDDILIKLEDKFSDAQLQIAIEQLWQDPDLSANLSRCAINYVRSHHHPAMVGEMYRDAIEYFSLDSAGANYRHLVRSLTDINTPTAPTEQDLLVTAASIAANQPAKLPRQILIDISVLLGTETDSDEYQIARDILASMLDTPSDGCRIEPIYNAGDHFAYARSFTTNLIGVTELDSDDAPIELKPGDNFIKLKISSQNEHYLEAPSIDLRRHSDKMAAVNIESLKSEKFLGGAHPILVNFLQAAGSTSDVLTCISTIEPNSQSSAPKVFSSAAMRHAARKQFGLNDSDILICLFGAITPNKFNGHLLDAWLKSPLAGDEHYHLYFVGEHTDNEFSKTLAATVAKSGYEARIKIISAQQTVYRPCLASADVVAQLPTYTQEDTSSLILDCLAYSIPIVFNPNGSSVQSIGRALARLPNRIVEVESDEMTEAAPAPIASRVLEIYRSAVMQAAGAKSKTSSRASAQTPKYRVAVAEMHSDTRQMLVDISFLVQHNLKSGIQRVVRNILTALLVAPPAGYRVEPIYDAGGYYAYARNFAVSLTEASDPMLKDEPIQIMAGDMFLGLDLSPPSVLRNKHVFADLRNHGVQIFFTVFDLLPVLRPDVFPKDAQANFAEWLDTVAKISDGLVCISRTVADELIDWLEGAKSQRFSSLRIGHFHLGVDPGANLPHRMPKERTLHARPYFLMVGTVEPRKGYAQALAAFEQLWAAGLEADLAIVGRQGWMTDQLSARLRTHPECGKRLFWFESADDDILKMLYETATALLLTSEGEGFGLPLIEAAQYGLPIIARDLPVFHEVAGNHAFYFSGMTADALANALRDWLKLYYQGRFPSSEEIRLFSWSESAQQLLHAIVNQKWYRIVPAQVELRTA